MFSDDSDVRRVTFAEKDNPDLVLPVPAKGTVKSIDFDVKTGFIYWIEERHGKKKLIRCVHEDGTGEQDLIKGEKPYDLAIEPFSHSIYWTSEADNTIRFAWLNDTTKKNGVVFPKKEGYRPRHIVVSPEQG